MEQRKKIVAVIIAMIVLMAAIHIGVALTNNDSGDKEVVNDLMKVKGIEEDGSVIFKNIPYAEAPVGELRFKPPVLKEANWTDVMDCTKYGNIAIQGCSYVSDDDLAPAKRIHAANESEDCLNLNIWAPVDAKKGDNLPVLFWINGGAFIAGYGQDELYDGNAFNRDGVILVTINYRIGTLGFLSLDDFKKDNSLGTTGNWGTLDQICALTWVNKYIENFGGDPKNITIGGQSAGSFAVMNLVVSPLAKGLFQKAIMESGAIMHIFDATRSYEEAVEVSKNVVKNAGVDPSDPDVIEKLRKMDAIELADACYFNRYLYMGHSHSMWSVNDGVVLPEGSNHEAIKNGQYNDVKMILGYNYGEGTMFVSENVTEEQMNSFIDKNFKKDDAAEIRKYYDGQTMCSNYEKMIQLVSMLMFKFGVVDALEHFSEHGSTVYGYEFTHKTNGNIDSFHKAEIGYVFGHDHILQYKFDTNDLMMMKIMHQYWVNFINTGDPNGNGLSTWPKYDTISGTAMNFGTSTASTEKWSESTVVYLFKDMYFDWYTRETCPETPKGTE